MMIPFSLVLDISQEVDGNYTNIESVYVFSDTRNKTESGLFVPITGERFDGHDFLKQAIEAGAAAAFWQKGRPRPDGIPNGFPLVLVNDPLQAMQELATRWRETVNPQVVAVTGSNGKTSTKDILHATLGETYRTYKTQGNFNNHIGLPLTILSMPETTEVLILEMGMNHFGEIALLSRIAKPDHAVITNIGESHIEFLGSREGIAKAKLEILEGLKPGGCLVIDGDEPLLQGANTDCLKTCGYRSSNDYVINQAKHTSTGYRFNVNGTVYDLPLLGDHHVKNATLAVAVGELLNLETKAIQAGLAAVKLSNMRFERVNGPRNAAIINDAYNASPTSMKAAIETIKHIPEFKKKVLVLGDMFELGPDEETLHRQVAKAIEPPITHVITVGQKAEWIADELAGLQQPVERHICLTHGEAARLIEPLLSPDCIVLLKASRGMKLEKILGLLDAKEGGRRFD